MNARIVIGMALALAIAGCASTPEPNAALVHARAVVEGAQADPNANRYAALDVEAAKKQLDIAEAEGHPSATDALTDPRPPEPGPGPGGAQGATPDPTTPDNEEENQ